MKKFKELLTKLKQLYWFAIDHDGIIERKNIINIGKSLIRKYVGKID